MRYDLRSQASAARMLAPVEKGGKGQSVTLSTNAPGAYDPKTLAVAGAGSDTQTGSGVELEYASSEIDGTNIVKGDTKFLLSPHNDAGQTITPPVRDTYLTSASGTRRVVKCNVVNPAGNLIYCELQLRGS